MQKSIIIIGAGIAGLSAGCYSQMNGYRTQIFEMHTLPGGVCTTWKRKGYKIDGCIHWLTGSRPGTSFYRMWEEVGAVQGRRFVIHDEYARIEGKDGQVFTVYCSIDRLEEHMKQLAPEDTDLIVEFTQAIRKIRNLPMPVDKAPELYSTIDTLKIMFKMLPYMTLWRKWGKRTIQDVAQRFTNPFLREAFLSIFNLQNPPDFPMMPVLSVLAWMDQQVAGYPIGGSLELVRAIEQRYCTLGGEIHYKSRVVKILVENDHAIGVRLVDGSEYFSDIVISAADGHTTIFNMLDGQYLNETIQSYYTDLRVYPPLIYIGLGVAREFTDVPSTATGIDFPLDESIIIGGIERKRLSAQIYNFDPTLAPSSKSFVKVHFASDYSYWNQ